ncbi:MAG: hypothetical protein IT385_02420 [Deltaproteobacteria bacterium]|nr:hypothetical protein [Deltaproteobacteria bacterium]
MHLSPSSRAAQSPSTSHWQVFWPGTHWPPAHASPSVHALPSLHSPAVGLKRQPAMGSQLSAVHGFWSLHAMSTPAHCPPWHWSLPVHALPLLQGRLLATLAQPVTGLHASKVHGFWSSQLLGTPKHRPFWHWSTSVHGFWSWQNVPLRAATGRHWAVSGSHVFLTHAVSPVGLQATTVSGSTTQRRLAQRSVPLHRSPSSKVAQSASVVHSHRLGPGSHTPAPHVSSTVHGLPSSQGLPSVAGPLEQVPLSGLQVSIVHALPSSHRRASPPHAPAPSQ